MDPELVERLVVGLTPDGAALVRATFAREVRSVLEASGHRGYRDNEAAKIARSLLKTQEVADLAGSA